MDNNAKYKITCERDGKRLWSDPDKDVSEYREVNDRIYEFIEELLIQSSQFDADKNEALSERLFDACNGFASERSPEGRAPELFDDPELPMLTVREVAGLTGRTKWAIYDMVHKNKIPHHRPRPDRIMFDRKEVMERMRTGNDGIGNKSNEGRKFTPKIKRKTRDLIEIREDENGVEHKVYLVDPMRAYRRQESADLLGITVGHLDDLAREGKIRRRKDALGSYFWGDDLIKYRERHPRRGGTRRK